MATKRISPKQPRQVSFLGSTGAQLSARIELPADDTPSAWAVFAHCFTCAKNYKAAVNISRALAQNGVGVLTFDFTGLGESEGDFADTTFSSNAADIAAAARFLETEFQAPQLLIGHSLGGTAVLRAAQDVPSAKAVATIAAPFDPSHLRDALGSSVAEIEATGEAEVILAGRRFNVRKALLEDLREARMDEAIRNLGRALLIFHSPSDDTVPVDNAAKIYTAAQHPKSFLTLDSADHLLTNAEDAAYVGSVLAAWGVRYLERPAVPATVEQIATDSRVVARTPEGGYRTEIAASGHGIVSDEPVAVGGTDAGPTPYDLLAAALGACTTMTLRMYADRKKWPLAEAIVRLRHGKIHALDEKDCESRPAKMDELERELELLGDLTSEQRQRLLEIANKCPVHRTLDAGVHVTTRLKET